ncbi:hypothetical protein DCF40_09675 [Edwardsiella piscicida]|uniref:hypothetical protein n=1 Tax=Edwardsiella piscicida TaxID=1263550 RepID=UPI001CEC75FA|nr:hypothetical protein [Edwardsiella piscicida]UBU79841.1 hypothetical protein A9797_18085 [Edwardsiella piscicida]UCQ29836.1 hypothetical protein DCF74_10020 [Edwardsiella piscicida]UCQ56112.1 hypothetical protein DCF40_09675 [Edwardsiella piscicida]
MNQRRYITQRIIDACLREDVAGVLSRATLRREGDTHWLYASHFAVPLRLAVSPHDYMQSWRATAPRWQEYHDGEWRDCEGYDAWLARLTPPDDPEARGCTTPTAPKPTPPARRASSAALSSPSRPPR